MAIVIASSFISFYHEFRLTLIMLAMIPICMGIHFLSLKVIYYFLRLLYFDNYLQSIEILNKRPLIIFDDKLRCFHFHKFSALQNKLVDFLGHFHEAHTSLKTKRLRDAANEIFWSLTFFAVRLCNKLFE